MRVKWYGHACFRLEGGGVSVITDPYTPEPAGLLPVRARADAVVISSALDEAHSNAAMIAGSPRVLNALDAVAAPVAIADGVLVEAVAAMEGIDRPDDPKANALYRFELDGVSVCHMGDVGRRLSREQLAPLRGRVDVLLALAGGGLTIALPDLDDAIAEIGPRVVIPMHYRTPSLRYQVGTVEEFLARRPGDPVVRHTGATMEIAPDTLPAVLTVHVLQPSCEPQAALSGEGR
ncbi:MAG TPA: MBL fold metallo-hydrolase [Solirubrobacteraceae bacterium]|nr:MBL fold metallo-hydrolase [Solirubrobacteraceae bacterium]